MVNPTKMISEREFSGLIFEGEELNPQKSTIFVKNGIIESVEDYKGECRYWIIPAFYNAHTHIGDTVAMDIDADGDLSSLVTPPSGLKHQILGKTDEDCLVKGMRSALFTMIESGTHGFADFREGGIPGINALRKAVKGLPIVPLILGRDGSEKSADGAGISSIRDVNNAEQIVRDARLNNKLVAFHAGEQDRLDIDAAIEFKPDLLIHCTYATKKQLKRCAEDDIAICVCPRSNWTLGVTHSASTPPLQEMYSLGCNVFIGTDNVMFNDPDIFSELNFISAIYKIEPGLILESAIAGSSLSNRAYWIKVGFPAHFTIIDSEKSSLLHSHNPLRSLVRRAGTKTIVKRVFNEYLL